MTEFPSLEIWTDAYLADTGDLELAEHGAYHLMLYIAWRRSDNALPNDMDWLKRAMAAHSKLHGHTFNAIVPKLLTRFWELSTDGKWRQKRLDRERQFRRENSSKARQNALKRWSNSSQTLFKPDAPDNEISGLADAVASDPHMLPTPPPKKEVRSIIPSTASAREGGHQNHPQNGNGYRAGTVTLDDPDQRIARFQQSLVPVLGGGSRAWDVIYAASDPSHPDFAISLARCKSAAKQLGKGWPHRWPRINARAPPPKL
jgi:uncharacterized protein YdaU (DUF1376 family)